ncbi:hypothetical protein BD769DRAFT_196552 [Suillus cothurnatus]|nr:hypothetical protein BD769DRAFT_196552 [Suillus cothurnatus]
MPSSSVLNTSPSLILYSLPLHAFLFSLVNSGFPNTLADDLQNDDARQCPNKLDILKGILHKRSSRCLRVKRSGSEAYCHEQGV